MADHSASRPIAEGDVSNVTQAIRPLCDHFVGAELFRLWQIFVSLLGMPFGEALDVEKSASKAEAPSPGGARRENMTGTLSKRLAEWMVEQEFTIDYAAECAYLAGSKEAACGLARIDQESCHGKKSPTNNKALEQEIRKRFWLPENLADLPGEKLLRMVVGGLPSSISKRRRRHSGKWKSILQGLEIKIPSPCTPSKVCQALYNWSKSGNPAGKVRELCNSLCKAEHFSALRELVLQAPKSLKRPIVVSVGGEAETSELVVPTTKNDAENFSLSSFEPRHRLIEVPKDKNLVGRTNDIAQLTTLLEELRRVLVRGLPGIGKTSTAIRLAHSVCEYYSAIVLIKCSSSSSFDKSLTEICRTIVESVGQSEFSPSGLLKYIMSWAKNPNDKILLIFDGLSDVKPDFEVVSEKIADLLGSRDSEKLHCLFTARKEVENIKKLKIRKVYELEPLKADDVRNMLIERCGADGEDDNEVSAANVIASKLGGIPHLVDLKANDIKQTGVSLSVYCKSMALKGGLRALDDAKEDFEEAKESYRKIITENATSPSLRELLLVFVYSDYPEPFPVDMLAIGGKKICDSALKTEYQKEKIECYALQDEETVDDAVTILTVMFTRLLKHLHKSHIIYFSKRGTASMHSAISEQIQELAESEWKEECSATHGLNILSSLLKATYEADRTDKTSVYEALMPHTFKFIANMKRRKLPIDPYLLLNFGQTASLLGHFKASQEVLKECEKLFTDENEDFRGRTLLALGNVCRQLGDLSEAENYLLKARRVWEQRSDSVQVTKAETKRAEVLMDASEFRKAYNLLKKVKKDKLSDLGSYYGNLGRACYGLQEYEKTIGHFEHALQKLGDKNEYKHGLFTAYQRLAETAMAIEKCKSSRRGCLRENVQSCLDACFKAEKEIRSKRGSKHRYVAFFQREIARLCLEYSDFQTSDKEALASLTSAFRLALDSLDSHVTAFGQQHQKVAKSCDTIAKVCCSVAIRGCAAKFTRCERLALERAISNYEIIQRDEFHAVEKIIKALNTRYFKVIEPRDAFGGSESEENCGSADVADSSFDELIELEKRARELFRHLKEDDE